MSHHYLHALCSPRSVAVFGASERKDSVGTLVLKNIIATELQGDIYPINPKYDQVQGLRCYDKLTSVKGSVDLAIVATPAKRVQDILRQCGAQHCKAVIVLEAGLGDKEINKKRLKKSWLEVAYEYGIHLVTGTSFGLIRPSVQLNASFSKNHARAGSVALVSQSDSMVSAILDWAATRQFGFSTVVTLGEMSNVDWGDVLDYLTLDPKTSSILLYIENIQHARSFMSGLRAASRMKPVIILKIGRYQATPITFNPRSMVVMDENDAFDAAMDRAGVVRTNSVTQLFSAAEILSSGLKADGNRLMIVANGRGPGIMAADRALENGLSLAKLSQAHEEQLARLLPGMDLLQNPVNILSDADAARYEKVLDICLEADSIDGVLVMLSPQAMTDPQAVANALIRVRERSKKPLLACWMGNGQVATGSHFLSDAGLPNFQTPEAAVEAFAYLASYHRNQRLLRQVPASVSTTSKMPDVRGARLIIESVLAEGRKYLSITESRAILTAFKIPSLPTTLTRSPTEALVAAESVGFPVAMKISSPDVLKQTDFSGVRLNINSAPTVRNVYQELQAATLKAIPDAQIDGVTVEPMYRGSAARKLLVGLARDPVFGPVIVVGSGDLDTGAYRDRAVVLPPLNNYMISKTLERAHLIPVVNRFSHLPAIDFEALQAMLLRVSELACELPEIVEMDINPLFVNDGGLVAVDVRIAIDYPVAAAGHYDHMAIHPYPHDLIKSQQLADGTDILIRPIRPEDAKLEQVFVRNLSGQSRYMRFMQALRELTPDMLVRLTQIDYDREMAFIALLEEEGKELEIGVARYAMNPDRNSCEFALVVADDWQKRGLGSLLMQTVIDVARHKGFSTIMGEVLAHNTGMLKLMERLGFESQVSQADMGVVLVSKRLRAA